MFKIGKNALVSTDAVQQRRFQQMQEQTQINGCIENNGGGTQQQQSLECFY